MDNERAMSCLRGEKLTIKVNFNSLHFIPTKTCFEKKPCVNRQHNMRLLCEKDYLQDIKTPYTEFDL